MRGNWQDYYWQDASRSHSAKAEVLVVTGACVPFTGMFPYVMLATTPLFYRYDWPRTGLSRLTRSKPDNKAAPRNDATAAVPDVGENNVDNSGTRYSSRFYISYYFFSPPAQSRIQKKLG